MSAEQGLRERLDDVLRTSAGNQARAYQDYAALLDRLASRKIKTVEFARDAVDLYLGALGKTASAGVTLVSETVSAGIKGVGQAAEAMERSARAAEVDSSVGATGAATAGGTGKPAGTPGRGSGKG